VYRVHAIDEGINVGVLCGSPVNSSTYRPDARSRAWIKSALRRTTEGVVTAWLPGNGAFAGALGSLVLAAYDSGSVLRYIGSVGTGFKASDRRALRNELDDIARPTSPLTEVPTAIAKTARYVEPVLIAEVEYRELTGDGVLRHPSLWMWFETDR
jgi:bifunctional non-homologous end joining protein LigD